MPANNEPNIIVDASVVAKWFFVDEKYTQAALKVKEDFLNKKVVISAPLFIFYEVNNLLKSACKSLRIEEEKATEAYGAFLDLDFVVYSTKDLLHATLETALKLDISSYDASYVVLAEYLRVPLFTADQKLLSKTESEFVRSLNDYPL